MNFSRQSLEFKRFVFSHLRNLRMRDDSLFPHFRRVKENNMSGTKIGILWPGDYRSKPNDLARLNAEMPYAEG